METGRLRIKVLKGLAATSELLQVQVDRESIVFELMLILHEQKRLPWRRQRILCEGQPVDECDRWSQITTEDSIDVQMLHCDHRHLTPIDDRLKLLAMVRCKGEALSFASQELKKDKEIVQIAMATSASSLQFASKSLKRDPELVELGISKDPTVFRIVGKIFRGDPVLAKQAIDADPHHILYCRPYLYRNKEFMKYCVQKRASLLRYARVDLGREIYLSALQQDGLLLRFLMRKDKSMLLWWIRNAWKGCNEEEFARTAVRQNGMALAFVSTRLLDDVQVAQEAVRNDERAIKFIGSKPVICQILKDRPSALKHAQWKFHDDVEVVDIAYSSDPKSLIYAGTEAALGMIKSHGPEILKLMKPSIQHDERILQAISECDTELSDLKEPALARARDESDSEDEVPPLPEMLRFPKAEAVFEQLPLDKDSWNESLINWRIERDDALGTLFFTFVLLTLGELHLDMALYALVRNFIEVRISAQSCEVQVGRNDLEEVTCAFGTVDQTNPELSDPHSREIALSCSIHNEPANKLLVVRVSSLFFNTGDMDLQIYSTACSDTAEITVQQAVINIFFVCSIAWLAYAELKDSVAAMRHGCEAFTKYWGLWNTVDWSCIGLATVTMIIWGIRLGLLDLRLATESWEL
eukprot:Skav218489  [mRNA]  locus=scaffold538:1295191:1304971:- [translate_table: standard]